MPSVSDPNDLASLVRQLESNIASGNHQTSKSLLSKAKIALLHQNALVPTPTTQPALAAAAQHVLELGALISIREQDQLAFTRYFQQLQPFYSIPSSRQSKELQRTSQRSKITGLYLLLLLSEGDYAGFHTLLEGFENVEAAGGSGKKLEDDAFVQYPIRLERWLMEGSYDRVWEESKSDRVPSEEFAIFSGVVIKTIRSEVASCSELSYPSIPVANAKSLLFLNSEGDVIQYAKERGWTAHDGRIYFPANDSAQNDNDVLAASGQVIENTLGYARELETIV